MYSHISAFCFPEYFSVLVLSILSPPTYPTPPKQVFRVSGLRIKILMVTRGKGGERIFLRKSGETREECWRSSVSDGRGVAATKECWVRDMARR